MVIIILVVVIVIELLLRHLLFIGDVEIVLIKLVHFSIELLDDGAPSEECLVVGEYLLIDTMLDHLHELS